MGKLCDSCWVSMFKLLWIVIFQCVPLSDVLNGFSCDIIGTIGVINIGGATVVGTLSVGTVIVTLRCAIIGISLGNTSDFFSSVSWC